MTDFDTSRVLDAERRLGVRGNMTEDEWLRCNSTNALFAAIERPTDQQISLFNVECVRHIKRLVSDDASRIAIEALENSSDKSSIPQDIAEAANLASSGSFNPQSPQFDPARNFNAAKAVAHAVCHAVPTDGFYHSADRLENARRVALYCQWAVASSADANDSVDCCENEAAEPELGHVWLKVLAGEAEAAAQCELFRRIFTRKDDREI